MPADEAELDELSRAEVEAADDKALRRRLDIIAALVGRHEPDKARRLILRFLVSPEEILGDESGRVTGIRLVKNRLEAREGGGLAARPTGETESHPCGLVFRSVGYRGVPLPELPFRDDWGVLPNESGRILDDAATPLPGLYASGWIKRGPSGVIGTNKPDAGETVRAMLEDVAAGRLPDPAFELPRATDDLLAERGVRPVSYADWLAIDEAEKAAGKAADRPRVKLVTRQAMRAALED